MPLKNKRVLITAGPTWIKIDSVRVISNIASGQTGLLLAKKLREAGASVTLLLGPSGVKANNQGIKILRFKFFEELKDIFLKELALKKYDIVVHAAAVSDYQPAVVGNHKIKSGLKNISLKLIPTPKIINAIKKVNPKVFAVGFKFEPRSPKSKLIKDAKRLIKCSGVDLVVANTVGANGAYAAYLVNEGFTSSAIFSKPVMIEKLIKLLKEKI